jgi:tRNA dimethylallyltransferase
MRTKTDDMMTLKSPKSVLLIAGPTASGKSALAVEWAGEHNGVVINADASQVYRELSILSARPTESELAQAPHRLYGHRSGSHDYSVGEWLKEVENCLDAVWSTGKLPIIVGGTGLYFMALEKGLAKVPPVENAIREKWRQFEGNLHSELALRHAPSAASLNPADRQRLIRALEVYDSTGKPLRIWQEEAQEMSVLRGAQVKRIYAKIPRDELYQRADARLDTMIEQGALREVEALPDLDPKMPVMKAIGVPQLLDHIEGNTSLAEAISLSKIATRHYIKRQLTWFRGQMKDWPS